jgi:hypothetical protein
MWREECANSNWLNINKDLAYSKIIICMNVIYLSQCKWENKVSGTPRLKVAGSKNIE